MLLCRALYNKVPTSSGLDVRKRISSGSLRSTEEKKGKIRLGRFHITMTEEVKDKKWKEIERMRSEEVPKGLFAKLKYYFKRYWLAAFCVHTGVCMVWAVSLYFLVKSGVDVISVLEFLHIPDSWIEKVRNAPPTAGVLVVVLLLYKIAIPLRYATTLAAIKVIFPYLKKFGMLKTAREVEYHARMKYERTIGGLNQRRAAGVTHETRHKAHSKDGDPTKH
ncbi:protein play a role in the structure and strength of muscle [Ditylenchus destructor]|nr:protein play a role in the structure and strength of muscle [Ditylenchus destructor]